VLLLLILLLILLFLKSLSFHFYGQDADSLISQNLRCLLFFYHQLIVEVGLELKDRLVGVQRVTKVTKGGRTFGFSAIVVVGDENGIVGQGLGKSKDVASAIAKAIDDAKKNLVRIPLNKVTLPHEQKGKYGGARVTLLPAAPGTGVIAGGAVRAVLEAVGIHDVLSKSQGSSNPHNVVKATFDALLKLRSAQTIANQRGISIEKLFKG